MLMDVMLVLAGLAALVVFGDMLVRGAVGVAQRAGLSPFVIGLTLVGFGTSVPELLTSLIAAQQGLPGIALGNVVGSNIANILLILGVTAAMGAISGRMLLERDGIVMVAVTFLCAGLILTGDIGRWSGVAFVVTLGVYLFLTLRYGQSAPDELPEGAYFSVWRGMAVFLVGLVGVMLGAKFLVQGASEIARAFDISESVIGLTIVAVGTSLPELVASVVAARRGQGALAVGNIIGSNIFNVLGILGITAVIYPMAVPTDMMGVTVMVFLVAAVSPMILAIAFGKISRWVGFAFVGAYAAYIIALVA